MFSRVKFNGPMHEVAARCCTGVMCFSIFLLFLITIKEHLTGNRLKFKGKHLQYKLFKLATVLR